MVHKLNNKWVWWYLPGDENDWSKMIRVGGFDSVEGFWSLYEHIRPPSDLHACVMAVFVQGIAPVWEDKGNKDGGYWQVTLSNDDVWLKTLLVLLSGNLPTAPCEKESPNRVTACVTGAMLNKRKNVSVWTDRAYDNDKNVFIVEMLRKQTLSNDYVYYKNGKDKIQLRQTSTGWRSTTKDYASRGSARGQSRGGRTHGRPFRCRRRGI